MLAESPQKATYGEKLVKKLLAGLPKDQFYTVTEPLLFDRYGGSSNPDFVTVARDYGAMVFEVKDWIKIVRYNRADDTITIEKRDGTEMVMGDPFRQCLNAARTLARLYEKREELIELYNGRRTLSFPYQPVVILPNISINVIHELVENDFWGKHIVWGSEDITSPERILHRIEALPWKFKPEKRMTQRTVDVMLDAINPTPGSKGIVPTKQQRDIINEAVTVKQSPLFDTGQLSNEAQQVITSANVRLVRGVAGSGKTLVLIRRAMFLAENYPDLRLCILSFNKDLADNLRQQIPDDLDADVLNFHKLCAGIIGDGWESPKRIQGWVEYHARELCDKYGFTVDFVAEEIAWRKDMIMFDNAVYLDVERKGRGIPLTQEKRAQINKIFDQYSAYQKANHTPDKLMRGMDWEDVPHIAAEVLLAQDNPRQYDMILIDEAQDFAPSWIEVIKLLLKKNGTLFICDDPTQSLFRYFSWKEKGVDVRGYTRILRVPFRCTREISVAAHSLIESDPLLSYSKDVTKPNFKTYELHHGSQPGLFGVQDIEREQEFIEAQINQLIATDVDGEAIAVLCHNKKLVREYAYLRDYGCYVQTFHKMKGLEFKAVFLPHLHTVFSRAHNPGDSETVSDTRKRVYTAMTRARTHLFMTYHGRLPQEFDAILPHVWHEKV